MHMYQYRRAGCSGQSHGRSSACLHRIFTTLISPLNLPIYSFQNTETTRAGTPYLLCKVRRSVLTRVKQKPYADEAAARSGGFVDNFLQYFHIKLQLDVLSDSLD